MISSFDPVGECIKRCPFLNALVVTQGESFAREVATDFSKFPNHTRNEVVATPPQAPNAKLQELQEVSQSFTLAHSQQGILPLSPPRPAAAAAAAAASLSLSGFWSDFNPFNFNQKKDKKPKQKKQNSSSGSQSSSSIQSMSSSSSGKCPLRKIFGPLASAVMSRHYQCPKPVVMMRAAIAKTPVVRALRPEALEVKLLAIALASMALNVPFGMLREHTKKFSPEWFLVVHATIPFIAMLRKAVVMPPYAILFTVAAAIGGQTIGAKAEKSRLQWGQIQKAKTGCVIESEDVQNLHINEQSIVV
eukprot:g586.t1